MSARTPTVYVAGQDSDDLVAAWDVVSRHFGAHDVPSTLLGVTVLGYRDQLVEVEAVAAMRDHPLMSGTVKAADNAHGGATGWRKAFARRADRLRLRRAGMSLGTVDGQTVTAQAR